MCHGSSPTKAHDGSNPKGECGPRVGHAGRTGQGCQGVEHQPTSGHQDADPSSARSAISGAKKRRLRLSGDSPESLRQSASPQFQSALNVVLYLLESKLAARAAGSTKQITEDMVMAKRDIFGELV